MRPPLRLDSIDLNSIIDQAVSERMEEHAKATRGLAPDRESLAEVVAQLLEECHRINPSAPLVRIDRPMPGPDGSASAYDLLLSHRDGEDEVTVTGLVLATGASANVMAPTRAKLRNDPRPPHRILLLTSAPGPALGVRGEEH